MADGDENDDVQRVSAEVETDTGSIGSGDDTSRGRRAQFDQVFIRAAMEQAAAHQARRNVWYRRLGRKLSCLGCLAIPLLFWAALFTYPLVVLGAFMVLTVGCALFSKIWERRDQASTMRYAEERRKASRRGWTPLPALPTPPDETKAIADELTALGFVPAGDFASSLNSGFRYTGFAHPGRHLYAAILQVAPSEGETPERRTPPWAHIVTAYADGATLAVTTNLWPESECEESTPKHPVMALGGAKMAEVVDAMERERPFRPFAEVSPGAVPTIFSRIERERYEWMEERWSEKRIDLDHAMDEELSRQMKELAGKDRPYGADGEDLVAIHDDMSRLSAWKALWTPDREEWVATPWAEYGWLATPREIARRAVADKRSPLVFIGTLSSPVAADVYRIPAETMKKIEERDD